MFHNMHSTPSVGYQEVSYTTPHTHVSALLISLNQHINTPPVSDKTAVNRFGDAELQ